MYDDGPQMIINARADLSLAEERYQSATQPLAGRQIRHQCRQPGRSGIDPAESRGVGRTGAPGRDQAKASLALIDTQIPQLTITRPGGWVHPDLIRQSRRGDRSRLDRHAAGRPDNLTIVVYIPETLYGQLSLGQSATLTVDSFPGETVHGGRDPDRKPGRVHPAQRPIGGRTECHRVCHHTAGQRPGR